MSKSITRERTGVLLRKLFELLIASEEGLQAKVALAALEGAVTLSDYEAGEYPSGGRRFEKIVRFATVDAVKAGWMRKEQGVWTVTDLGVTALHEIADPAEFYREAARLYRDWKKEQELTEEDEASVELQAEAHDAQITYEMAEEQAADEIKQYLTEINPYDLQDLVAALLEGMGYHVSWISPPGKDGGIDVLAWNDPLGTKPPRIKVQVKRRKDNISAEELRSFLALVNDDDVGLFVTTGGFTKDAEELARAQERRKITLINRRRLVDLWIEYNDRIDRDKRRLLPLKPIYFIGD